MVIKYSLALLIVLLFFSCNKNENSNHSEKDFVKIEGQKFIDSNGREIIFSGTNYISKDPEENYMPQHNEEIFEQFKTWGFNCIRLGIIWDGLEPEPGVYNEDYLKEIDKRIQWAANNGIYVFLDMHQDLYSSKYSDGAPDWVTLDEGQPHYTGSVWSDSYLISPAVQTAFDNFWENTPVSDGVGVQDHYANLWKHVAKRYANNTTVIGYDIMNEPFMGTSANQIMPLMLGAYAKLFAEETGQIPPSAEKLSAMWGEEESRMEALDFISTKERFSKVVDAVYDVNAAFEKNELQNMYQKVANAIREVDTSHILFLNHSYFANTGVSSAIEPTKLPDGNRDPLVAYAAHGYDLVVDTKNVDSPSYERVEFIFDRINKTGKRLNIPVLVGEWGAFHGKSPKLIETAQHVVNLFEGHNFSNTYWCYYNNIENDPYFLLAVVRPFPMLISGDLVTYNYNFETGDFYCVWNESTESSEPTVIYVPNLQNLTEYEVDISPVGEQIVFEYFDKSNAGKLLIAPTGKSEKRTLKFKILPGHDDDFMIK
ncbi:endoglycosylceramidase [Mariniphaga anaerophila]|uniref:Endoglycosylceramidase n=1 Tax=Mariniphaga anaerophila TaxID=1484053 RepID=A0A1M4XLN7_9BACT|nr:cellulase family glycosylhydrolase [Mariniphaga anaerophila]SHE94102.1 endoglycosylceramidase [Mariniphaga anaerophila]